MKEVVNTKKKLVITLVFAMLLGITASAIFQRDPVTVVVYENKFDEEYIKNITFDDGTKVGDYDYIIQYANLPKTRASRDFSFYFDYASWITRDGVASLSLAPTHNLRISSSYRDSGWNILKSVMDTTPSWPKDSSRAQTFRWQYDCHWQYANAKDTWNLEPHRNASSYTAVVVAGCNP